MPDRNANRATAAVAMHRTTNFVLLDVISLTD